MPCPHLCLLTLLVCVAFKENAFSSNRIDLHSILEPKGLEGSEIEYTPLKWKDEFLDRDIINIPYQLYLTIWKRVLMVAGLSEEDSLRPYAMRVGAGGRLDGKPAQHLSVLCSNVL